jgi:NAD+ synthase (glutamine-hydrolysing)
VALGELAAATADLLFVVGAPLRQRDRLFNTAVVLHRGSVLGVVPKIHLPTYRGFYERRQFASGDGIVGQTITVAGQPAPFGTALLFTAADLPGLTVGVEICEDMFVPMPPASALGLAGATVLLKPVRQPHHHRPGRHPRRALPGPVHALPVGLPVRGGRAR